MFPPSVLTSFYSYGQQWIAIRKHCCRTGNPGFISPFRWNWWPNLQGIKWKQGQVVILWNPLVQYFWGGCTCIGVCLESLVAGQVIIHHEWCVQHRSQHSHQWESEAATNLRHKGIAHCGSDGVFAWEIFSLDEEVVTCLNRCLNILSEESSSWYVSLTAIEKETPLFAFSQGEGLEVRNPRSGSVMPSAFLQASHSPAVSLCLCWKTIVETWHHPELSQSFPFPCFKCAVLSDIKVTLNFHKIGRASNSDIVSAESSLTRYQRIPVERWKEGQRGRHKKRGFICSFCCTHSFYFGLSACFPINSSYLNLTWDLKCTLVY